MSKNKSKSNVSDITSKMIIDFQNIEGKIVGKEMQPSSIKLAKNDKGAMVNDIVDKYMSKELNSDYLEQVKEDYKIEARDILKEIAKREIQKILGK